MTQTTCFAGHWESRIDRIAEGGTASGRGAGRAFAGVVALGFGASAAATVIGCGPMAGMRGMPMPGGWTMSMMWMRMPGQTWAGAGAWFTGMWVAMMAAMMLPSLAPVLWRYRQEVGKAGERRADRRTALAALGYFLVWAVAGMGVFAAGAAAAAIEMAEPGVARAVPMAGGLAVLMAGAVQFTRWKAHHLSCCREAPGRGRMAAVDGAAWRRGVELGMHCGLCCANLTVVLLVVGVMDLRAMAAVTAAITAERLAPAEGPLARAIGVALAGAGVLCIAQAAGLR